MIETKDKTAETIGMILGLLVLLWGFNSLTVWAFNYPAVYCLADALAFEGLRAWYRFFGVMLILYMIIMLAVKGLATLPLNLGMVLLYEVTPLWFELWFRAEVGCGPG